MSALTRARAEQIIEGFPRRTVAVIGDAMLDQFVIGRVDRISPEAPVPVVRFDHEEFRIGGAANVAHNIRALGGRSDLLAVVGDDDAGRRLRGELQRRSIGVDGVVVVPGLATTRKLRVVTARNQQVARIDYEDDGELDADAEAALIGHIGRAVRGADVLVVSDYLKGTITRRVMSYVLECGRARQTPVLVDPKIPHLDRYTGCGILTPNHHEAETAARMRIRHDDDARAAARALQASAGCDCVLITRGEHGMWLLEGERAAAGAPPTVHREVQLPAVAREVADVTGAGDTVISTMALGLSAGASALEAAQLANHAAGLAVGKFGPATVSAAELIAAFG